MEIIGIMGQPGALLKLKNKALKTTFNKQDNTILHKQLRMLMHQVTNEIISQISSETEPILALAPNMGKAPVDER